MQLMYLARLTRPDVLLPVTFLATRSNKATRKDMRSVQQVINYLVNTIDVGINICCTELQFFIMADASYGIHEDGKGHTGYLIGFGRALSYLHACSAKQKTISHSSTDAEIVAFFDCLKLSVWTRNVLTELGITPLKKIQAF
jgi:hypothetical protein